MRLDASMRPAGLLSLAAQLPVGALSMPSPEAARQVRMGGDVGAGSLWPASGSTAVPGPLLWDLERMSRIADIAYCVGNTGVHKPFKCLSRCAEFPELALDLTWNTGPLMSDSCGYVAVDGGNSTGGSPAARRGAIIVAFRGTYSIANTIVDLSTVPQPYTPYPSPDGSDHETARDDEPQHRCNNCTVHTGFFQAWLNTRRLVVPRLKTLREQHPSKPIHLVGHSLGGAIACLAALELRVALGWQDVVTTTFGQPRVGNYQLARFIDAAFGLDNDADAESRPYRRVTHINDPVPLVPWDEWGYRSHAGEIFITKPGIAPSNEDLRMCVGDSDPACSSGVQAGWWWQAMRRLNHVGAGYLATALSTRFELWQLFLGHRDYFWRLGMCVPGGDPANWGRRSEPAEL